MGPPSPDATEILVTNRECNWAGKHHEHHLLTGIHGMGRGGGEFLSQQTWLPGGQGPYPRHLYSPYSVRYDTVPVPRGFGTL